MALSDREKIETLKAALRRKYTGVNLTSGLLEIGKYYRISYLMSADDFRNIGAITNWSIAPFKATGTTPTTWTSGSVLNEILLDALKADADTAATAATSTITITSGAFEGGSGSGEITFDRILMSKALEELIQELDPGFFAPAVIPRREMGVTVRLGC